MTECSHINIAKNSCPRCHADTIAALRQENERLTRELGDAHVHSEAQQRRYLQSEATAAAVVGALEHIGELSKEYGLTHWPANTAVDMCARARNTLATLSARAVAMAEVVAALEAMSEAYDIGQMAGVGSAIHKSRKALAAYSLTRIERDDWR